VIEDDVRTYLLTQSPITTLVGTDVAGTMARIYLNRGQQNITADRIVMRRIGTGRQPMLASAMGAGEALIEFDCIGLTAAKAKTLANTLRGEMDGYRGTMGSATIHWTILDDEFDDSDDDETGGTDDQPHVTMIYRIQFLETIPTFV
jgi:hypothetical protein